MRCKKGQSILEYVIILTVIVAAIAYFSASTIKPAIQNAMKSSQGAIQNAASQLPGANTATGTSNATP